MTDRVLAVCDFTGNTEKFERHLLPLAATANVTVACVTPDEDIDDLEFVSGPSVGVRPLDLLVMFGVALLTAVREDFDGVVSFSLVPHGIFALAVGRLTRRPVHLGIIGAGVDVHAYASYRRLTRVLLRRFDIVSVPGEEYAEELGTFDVPDHRIARLVNPIDRETFRATDGGEPTYDYLWVGRFQPEKQPAAFVDALAQLPLPEDASAAMVGDGQLREDIEARAREHGIADRIDFPGWVEDTAPYYQDARMFVVTSSREALPLTLLEAMASGCACIVPPVGNVPDVATDEETALIVDEPTPDAIAEAIRRLQAEPALRSRLANRATRVREEYSYETATREWRAIIDRMTVINRAAGA